VPRVFAAGCGVACAVALIVGLGCVRVDPSRRDPAEGSSREADQGDAAAQYQMGVRIAGSPESAPDYARAAGWFRRAADQGHAGAQAALAFLYHRGQGVPPSDIEAIKWLNLASAQRAPEHEAYALWREWIARQMNPADVAEGDRLARTWRRSR
jgi:hypothetical protein